MSTTTQSTTVQISLDALVSATDAARKSTTNTRWLTAIEKAYNWLVQQDTVRYDAVTHELALVSPDSFKLYIANSQCQCEAFAKGQACWHRASARLVRRALEHQQKAQQIKALGDRLAERRRAFVEVDELFV